MNCANIGLIGPDVGSSAAIELDRRLDDLWQVPKAATAELLWRQVGQWGGRGG
jgi:hypothetical protein